MERKGGESEAKGPRELCQERARRGSGWRRGRLGQGATMWGRGLRDLNRQLASVGKTEPGEAAG